MIKKFHNHRPTHGTLMKSLRLFTVTIHPKDKKSISTNSLYLIKIIAKLERAYSNAYHKNRPKQNHQRQLEVHKTKIQHQQKYRLRTDSSLSTKMFAPSSIVVNIQSLFSLHEDFLTNAMHHHREKIYSNSRTMMKQRKGLMTHR